MRGAGSAWQHGKPAARSAPQLAQLAGRGVTVLTDAVELDGSDNRMWSDGPGKATLLVTRDLQGKHSAARRFRWKSLARRTAVRRPDDYCSTATCSSPAWTARCTAISLRQSWPRRFKFGQQVDQANMNLSEIECRGQVTIENVSRDAVGVTSHERMQLGAADDQSANGRDQRRRAGRDSLDAVWQRAGRDSRAAGR